MPDEFGSCPAGQCVHVLLPVAVAIPVVHLLHSMVPVPLAKWPNGQGEHSDALMLWDPYPSAHGVQEKVGTVSP